MRVQKHAFARESFRIDSAVWFGAKVHIFVELVRIAAKISRDQLRHSRSSCMKLCCVPHTKTLGRENGMLNVLKTLPDGSEKAFLGSVCMRWCEVFSLVPSALAYLLSLIVFEGVRKNTRSRERHF